MVALSSIIQLAGRISNVREAETEQVKVKVNSASARLFWLPLNH